MKRSQTKLQIVRCNEMRAQAGPPKQARGGPRPVPRYTVRICTTFIRLPRATKP
jgi:hypothetical protein